MESLEEFKFDASELCGVKPDQVYPLVISNGEVVVPRGDTVLSVGDEVLILSECGEETLLRKTFGVHPESL